MTFHEEVFGYDEATLYGFSQLADFAREIQNAPAESTITTSAETATVLSLEFTSEDIAVAGRNAAHIRAGHNRPSDYTTSEIIALQRLHPEVMLQTTMEEVQNA